MRRILTTLTLLALLAGACGDDSSSEPAADRTTTTGEVADDDTASEGARQVVSLSATATESLFAIGAGDNVIAVDSQSNHPPEAPKTDIEAFSPSVEAVIDLEPDLVVMSFDPGEVQAGLEAAGIEVLVQAPAANLDDAYAQIEQLGAATGHVADAAELVSQIQTDLAAAVEAAPRPEEPLTFFHEVDNTLYSTTSSSFLGELYAMLGLENIADAADDGTGFPQLNAEYIIDADPDIIFLADAGFGESAETVAARPGWDTMQAVRNGHVFEVDADLASRWGPRVVDFVQTVSELLTQVAEPAGA